MNKLKVLSQKVKDLKIETAKAEKELAVELNKLLPTKRLAFSYKSAEDKIKSNKILLDFSPVGLENNDIECDVLHVETYTNPNDNLDKFLIWVEDHTDHYFVEAYGTSAVFDKNELNEAFDWLINEINNEVN